MTKSDLVAAAAAKAGVTKKAAGDVLEALIDAITKELAKGKTVTITGFGTFRVSKRAARTGVNPRNPKEKIKILMDNHKIHTSIETREYLKTVPDKFEFVFTPKHASWLNIIESFFSKMTRSMLRGIRVESIKELGERISQYINQINEKPVIFKWKYKIKERDEMPGRIMI